MPNVVDDFDVRDHIFAVDVQHESVIVGESERIVDLLRCVADQ